MKPPPFEYVRPEGLDEAVHALSQPDAKVLAGGQSLLPLLSMRLAAPRRLVDVNRLGELSYVRTDEAGVSIGALARHADVEQDDAAHSRLPLLRAALRLVAHPTIRNRGTTVGSIVHADAAAEMPTVLALLDGVVTLRSPQGERTVAAADFFLGPLEADVRPGEIVTQVHLPARDAGTAIDEIARRHGDYALVGAAATVEREGRSRVGLFAVADTPVVVDVTDATSLDAAVDVVQAAVDPDTDIHASADYRRQLVDVLTRRVLTRAREAA